MVPKKRGRIRWLSSDLMKTNKFISYEGDKIFTDLSVAIRLMMIIPGKNLKAQSK